MSDDFWELLLIYWSGDLAATKPDDLSVILSGNRALTLNKLSSYLHECAPHMPQI